jgi:hypothetical protein
VGAEGPGLPGALQHRRELRPADTGHHPGGAHGAWPHAHLDDVRPRLDQVARALGGDHVASDQGHLRLQGADGPQGVDHPVLVPVRGVEHEGVHPGVEQPLRLRLDVTVDPHGCGDPQVAGGVDRRPVEGGAQGGRAGQHADEPTVGIDHGGHPAAGPVQLVERPARRHVLAERGDLVAHHRVHLGESVHPPAVVLRDDAHRPAVDDHERRSVRTLRDQRQRVGHRVVGVERDGGVEHQVALLDPPDDLGDHGAGDVLGDHRDPAASGDRLRHAAPGHRGHVRHDQGQGGAGAVVGGQVDVVTGRHRGPARHHEHVVVGQVVGRDPPLVEELHRPSLGGSG